MVGQLNEKKQQITWKNRGSMTVELALIFPFIIVTILVAIHILIILYQYATLQSLVNHTGEEAAKVWGKIQSHQDITQLMKTGQVELKDLKTPLYWRLTLLDNTTIKEKKVEDYLKTRLKEKSILGLKESKVSVQYKDYIIHKEITVEVSVKYKIPIPFVREVIDFKDGYTAKVTSKSRVKDSAELIRNVDFVLDTMNDFEITKNLKTQYNELLVLVKEKISDYFQRK